LADVSAKEGTQETAVTLLGMLCGLGLTNLLREQPDAIWIAFWVLTAVHVVANYIAVSALCLRTINTERLQVGACAVNDQLVYMFTCDAEW
jgi:hypothetical protein